MNYTVYKQYNICVYINKDSFITASQLLSFRTEGLVQPFTQTQ